MIKLKTVGILLISSLIFSACEKDDICVEGDTPQLIVRFYDALNPTDFKTVTGIRVVGAGKDITVSTFTDRGTLDSIAIPLNPGERISEFLFISESEDDTDGFEAGNIDGLNFTYEVQEAFVGRACGFVPSYDALGATVITDTDNWIQNIEITKAMVKTEDTLSAHVKIFH